MRSGRSPASRRPAPQAARRAAPPASRRPPPALVEVRRGGLVESTHRGAVAVCVPDGSLRAAAGDADLFIFLRSAAKPFQLAPLVAAGIADEYHLSTEELAVMAASHSGEDRHVRTVQSILRRAGLPQSVLACGTHPPFDAETAARLIRDGEEPMPIRHNCSGKHAAMALFAKASGWPVDGYWRPDHPVQQAAVNAIGAVSGVPPGEVRRATDGCGVVTFGVPLRALATAFARLAEPSAIEDARLAAALGRIRDAMMTHPELVAGQRRLDTALMRAAPGRLVAKGGAEGISGVGLLAGTDDGQAVGVAVAIEDGDGARRAVSTAVCAALRQLGALDDVALGGLAAFASPPIRDPRGGTSGEVRPAFRLA